MYMVVMVEGKVTATLSYWITIFYCLSLSYCRLLWCFAESAEAYLSQRSNRRLTWQVKQHPLDLIQSTQPSFSISRATDATHSHQSVVYTHAHFHRCTVTTYTQGCHLQLVENLIAGTTKQHIQTFQTLDESGKLKKRKHLTR